MQQVLQLAHIALQGVLVQLAEQMGRQGRRVQAGFPGDLGQQSGAQGGEVSAPLPQRRGGNFNHVQAVEQVLAEPPGLDFFRQILVGGADDAHIHGILHR